MRAGLNQHEGQDVWPFKRSLRVSSPNRADIFPRGPLLRIYRADRSFIRGNVHPIDLRCNTYHLHLHTPNPVEPGGSLRIARQTDTIAGRPSGRVWTWIQILP